MLTAITYMIFSGLLYCITLAQIPTKTPAALHRYCLLWQVDLQLRHTHSCFASSEASMSGDESRDELSYTQEYNYLYH